LPFIAGAVFSAADITAEVTVDFATKAIDMPIPVALIALRHWHEKISARPSMAA
jgi:glutathione S-transferase